MEQSLRYQEFQPMKVAARIITNSAGTRAAPNHRSASNFTF
jgi:hypothetical protein